MQAVYDLIAIMFIIFLFLYRSNINDNYLHLIFVT